MFWEWGGRWLWSSLEKGLGCVTTFLAVLRFPHCRGEIPDRSSSGKEGYFWLTVWRMVLHGEDGSPWCEAVAPMSAVKRQGEMTTGAQLAFLCSPFYPVQDPCPSCWGGVACIQGVFPLQWFFSGKVLTVTLKGDTKAQSGWQGRSSFTVTDAVFPSSFSPFKR